MSTQSQTKAAPIPAPTSPSTQQQATLPQATTPAGAGVRATPPQQQGGSSWQAKIGILSLVCSIASAGIASFSLHESHETRLDALRARVRSEALHGLSQARLGFAVFNCYASIRGKDNLPRKQDVQNLMDTLEPQIRASLDKVPDWNEEALMTFETSLNQTLGKPTETLNEVLLKVRPTWSKEDLERADQACKSGNLG
ncbi:hypothetical protein [Burkholderia ubonensis]|uniref:hypothetical protein n=1 Tax=Burkholderia ubonensis TaxID=101571 RepID=UPI0012F86BD6|nr:hypothetical protein [Burkholderia ubonensis]